MRRTSHNQIMYLSNNVCTTIDRFVHLKQPVLRRIFTRFNASDVYWTPKMGSHLKGQKLQYHSFWFTGVFGSILLKVFKMLLFLCPHNEYIQQFYFYSIQLLLLCFYLVSTLSNAASAMWIFPSSIDDVTESVTAVISLIVSMVTAAAAVAMPRLRTRFWVRRVCNGRAEHGLSEKKVFFCNSWSQEHLLHGHFECMCVNVFVCLFACLVGLFVYLFNCLLVGLFICLFVGWLVAWLAGMLVG